MAQETSDMGPAWTPPRGCSQVSGPGVARLTSGGSYISHKRGDCVELSGLAPASRVHVANALQELEKDVSLADAVG